MADKILVGTSGWHYAHWQGPFYPENIRSEEMLDFYVRHFQTVEINNSFYHLPSRQIFRLWYEHAPPRFIFAIKASRYITHMKKLNDPAASIEQFFAHTSALEKKTGPILFQLPPRWGRDVARLRAFLEALPQGYRYTFEFRDPSWFEADVNALLRKHNAASCVFDLAGQQSPQGLTANFAYLRLHGPSGQKYAGRYTRRQLSEWLELCGTWISRGARQVFVYFDNDQLGYATLNALELQEMAAKTKL